MKIVHILILGLLSFPCFSKLMDETPLPDFHTAAYFGKMSTLKNIALKEDINLRDHKNRTPLHSAIEGNQLKAVKFLIANGADIEAIDQQHSTPLNYACRLGYIDIVKKLLESGANVYGNKNAGFSPLDSAVYHSYIEIVKILIDNGTDVNFKKEDGFVSLYFAVNDLAMTRFLLDKGAEVNVVTNNDILYDGSIDYGESIFHRAIFHQNIEVIKLLLENGADVSINHGDGRTTLEVAQGTGNEDVIKLIKSALK